MQKEEKNKINYVSLDNIQTRALAIEDPELFLQRYKMPLIIDEFKYAPDLLSYIKIIVDKKDKIFLPSYENIKNLDVVERFGLQVGNGGVICLNREIFPLDKNNNLIPIELI